MDQRKRFVFAEGHQMNFVVDKNALALCVEEQLRCCMAQSFPAGLGVRRIHRRLPFDHPRKKRMLEINRQFRGELGKLRILKRKRRGRFRPYQQVRFVCGRREADSPDFLELRGMQLKPIAGVRMPLREN